jgi:hypothetical protein
LQQQLLKEDKATLEIKNSFLKSHKGPLPRNAGVLKLSKSVNKDFDDSLI